MSLCGYMPLSWVLVKDRNLCQTPGAGEPHGYERTGMGPGNGAQVICWSQRGS